MNMPGDHYDEAVRKLESMAPALFLKFQIALGRVISPRATPRDHVRFSRVLAEAIERIKREGWI